MFLFGSQGLLLHLIRKSLYLSYSPFNFPWKIDTNIFSCPLTTSLFFRSFKNVQPVIRVNTANIWKSHTAIRINIWMCCYSTFGCRKHVYLFRLFVICTQPKSLDYEGTRRYLFASVIFWSPFEQPTIMLWWVSHCCVVLILVSTVLPTCRMAPPPMHKASETWWDLWNCRQLRD